jgi:hypothetical protein
MTLIEKFHEWLKTEPLSNKERPTLREYQCEKIADDYAIEFAEWCDDNYFKNGKGNSNWSASMDWDDDEKFTTKELLEIFKKGL